MDSELATKLFLGLCLILTAIIKVAVKRYTGQK